MHSSLVLSSFTLLCNHHQYPLPESFITLNSKSARTLHSSISLPRVACVLPSVSMNLAICGTSDRWDHKILPFPFYLILIQWKAHLCLMHILWLCKKSKFKNWEKKGVIQIGRECLYTLSKNFSVKQRKGETRWWLEGHVGWEGWFCKSEKLQQIDRLDPADKQMLKM